MGFFSFLLVASTICCTWGDALQLVFLKIAPNTVEANQELGFAPDLRDYGIGAQILVKLGLTRIKLITNNPRKIIGLSAYGLTVAERIDIGQFVKKENQRYLETKRDKLGHLIEIMAEKKERK